MNTALCCTKCGEVVFKAMGDSTKLRVKVLVFKDNKAVAVCKGCGSEIPVPVILDEELMKSWAKSSSLRLYVSK